MIQVQFRYGNQSFAWSNGTRLEFGDVGGGMREGGEIPKVIDNISDSIKKLFLVLKEIFQSFGGGGGR